MADRDVEIRIHDEWLGMIERDGLVVTSRVLAAAQCAVKRPTTLQTRLRELAADGVLASLPAFFRDVLGLAPERFDDGGALPPDLELNLPDLQQRVAPTLALRAPEGDASRYLLLVWEIDPALDLDRAETVTGRWHAPPAVKFERLLRETRIGVGVLTNRRSIRLIHAPHGESAGSLTWHVEDLCSVDGRSLLDALVMLLGENRLFVEAADRRLPALLRRSREHQADVTTELADQVLAALRALLRAFEDADRRAGGRLLREVRAEARGEIYGGLLATLLRLVFVLYAEDRKLLPTESQVYFDHYSLTRLFSDLQADAVLWPESMNRRFSAWPRLLTLFRMIFDGGSHGALNLPARRGRLFDPDAYLFLEGRPRASHWATWEYPPQGDEGPPTVDDGTILRVLESLVMLGGERLSYKALDVEQIGSVYEALMGFDVVVAEGPSVALKPHGIFVDLARLLALKPESRAIEIARETDAKVVDRVATALRAAGSIAEIEAALEPLRVAKIDRAEPGQLLLQPGQERRRTGSHYTPRELTAPIVERTLRPLLDHMGEVTPAKLLDLKICDPAMGSGAFLVEACRLLADRLVEAWARTNTTPAIPPDEDPTLHARRLVAQRCLYGVDKNPFAVDLAKLSMWLVTFAKDHPFTFLDHAVRHGDSLVGLSALQIASFSLDPAPQTDLFHRLIEGALKEALDLRQQIVRLALDETVDPREKEKLLGDAEHAMNRARGLGDLVVAAFFRGEKKKERERERTRLYDLAVRWLTGDGAAGGEIEEIRSWLRDERGLPAFHWELEFPEVFTRGRRDPLDGDRANEVAWFDALVGNPPFAGKNGITAASGEGYIDWLKVLHAGAHGNADLVAHFFRRAFDLLGAHGCFGLLATNTIRQGDTWQTGLLSICANDGRVYHAIRSYKWPGAANVEVSVVHVAKGRVGPACVLDGVPVQRINSRLRSREEVPPPRVLARNGGKSFQGSIVLGTGFLLTPDERDRLVAENPRNAERIFPYIGGEELNSSPRQEFERYVINFGEMSLEEAERWPDLIAIVREKVKPMRDASSHSTASWWHFERLRPGLYRAIAPLSRCLVVARKASKHFMLTMQRTDRVFDDALVVFVADAYGPFALLQSRVHEVWAREWSGTMRTDLRYTPTDCFETFPFPPDVATKADLEATGRALYEVRAALMIENDEGLTKTYNRVVDPDNRDPRIERLRDLHRAMDDAVLRAYGWRDLLPAPPYGPPLPDAYREDLLDRLLALNQQYATEDAALGPGARSAKRMGRGRRQREAASDQLPLGPGRPKIPARR